MKAYHSPLIHVNVNELIQTHEMHVKINMNEQIMIHLGLDEIFKTAI